MSKIEHLLTLIARGEKYSNVTHLAGGKKNMYVKKSAKCLNVQLEKINKKSPPPHTTQESLRIILLKLVPPNFSLYLCFIFTVQNVGRSWLRSHFPMFFFFPPLPCLRMSFKKPRWRKHRHIPASVVEDNTNSHWCLHFIYLFNYDQGSVVNNPHLREMTKYFSQYYLTFLLLLLQFENICTLYSLRAKISLLLFFLLLRVIIYFYFF